MSLADIRKNSRRAVHDHMGIEASYYAPESASAIPCLIRFHQANSKGGDMQGFTFAPAERFETTPTIISDDNELTPKKSGVFVLPDDLKLTVQSVEPSDGMFTKSNVATATKADLQRIPE